MEENVSFSSSAYAGFEEEVIRLRNRNRSDPKSRTDFDWRYKGEQIPLPPVLFWIHSFDGTRIGMAGLIFRSYWVNNYHYYFAVLGDISLDKEFRGKGIAKRFFQFINNYIENHNINCSLVIPNLPAQKSLSSVGWKIQGAFVTQVYLVNPSKNIYGILKNRLIANLLGQMYRFFSCLRLWFLCSGNLTICLIDKFDDSFDLLWQSLPKVNIIMRDRSIGSLKWRYQTHPENKFTVSKFFEGDRFVGYLIYTMSDDNMQCHIYDFVVLRETLIKPAMSMFILKTGFTNRVNTIRMTLNQDHPYSKTFKKMGFFCRKEKEEEEIVYQTYNPTNSEFSGNYDWFLTIGDKDV